jgi:hypothetical protein
MKSTKIVLKEVKQPVVAALQGPGPHEAPVASAKQVKFFKSVAKQSASTKKAVARI